jgi:hypothetical protein
MTQKSGSAFRSMLYTTDEVLSGMLASVEGDAFTDDPQRLGEVFRGLSQQTALFAPFAALVGETDFSAVLESGLQTLVSDGHLQHDEGEYRLTPQGRARCVTGKRTLFNVRDISDLEAGARFFQIHVVAGPDRRAFSKVVDDGGDEDMSAELGSSRERPYSGSGESVSLALDLGLLWYLHEVGAGHLIADCEHAKCAIGTTLLLEEAIVCCEDTEVGEAAIQLGVPELIFLLGLAHRGDKDSAGRPVGLEASRRLMRARLLLERGQIATAPHGDKSYVEALQDGDE